MKQFLRYIGASAARKDVCMYELAAKYDWNEYEVWNVLRGRMHPTPAMRRLIAKELEVQDSYLAELLAREPVTQ